MKKILIISFLIPSFLFGTDLVCMGNSNTNQLIQVEVKLDTRMGKVAIEGNTHELLVSNKYLYVWQNKVDNQQYTNSLSRIDGSLTVVADGENPVVRAILACKEEKDLLF